MTRAAAGGDGGRARRRAEKEDRDDRGRRGTARAAAGGGGHGGDGGWVRARLREDKVGDSLGSCRMFLAGRLASGLSYWAPVGPRKPSGASLFPVVTRHTSPTLLQEL